MATMSRYGNVEDSKAVTGGVVNQPAQSVLAIGGSAGGGDGSSPKSSSGTVKKTESSTNIDPKSLAALQALIAQLSSGGTPQQKADQAQRQQEIERNRQAVGDYSKSAAFSDASGAMQAQMAQALQQLLPDIVRSAEGAGTSQNSLRALLTQNAGQQAAQSAAQLGLQAAQHYGNIGVNYSNVLEALTRPNDAATNALIQALNIAKNAVTSGTSTTNSTENTSVAGGNSGGSGGNRVYSSGGSTQQAGTTPFAPESYGISAYKGPLADSDGNTYSSSGQGLAEFIASTQDPWNSYSF